MSDRFKMNYPFYMYPGAPLSGYFDPMFLSELNRLSEYLEQLDRSTDPILLHLTIGAPIEELKNINPKYSFQYRQLFPDHLQETAKLGVKVVNLMIIPNENSNPFDEKDSNPFHMMSMNDADLVKKSASTYTSTSLPIEMEHFYTMMPTNDIKRNKRIINRLIEGGIEHYYPDIDRYRQTDEDLLFVDRFYHKLNQTVQKILANGGAVTCFSFAVFNKSGSHSHIDEYAMFPEITKIFNSERTMLAEWIFRENIYHVVPYDHQFNELCYIAPYEILDITRFVDHRLSADENMVSIVPGFENNRLTLNYVRLVNIINE